MEYQVKVNKSDYKVDAVGQDDEALALLTKAMESFYKKEIKYKAQKEQYEIARYQMEKMFGKGHTDFGLRKIAGKYISVTYIPASEGETTVERVFSEAKTRAILDEFGIDEEEHMEYVEKTTGKRKESIRVGAE